MASANKKKKLENSYQVPDGLKRKIKGIRRMSFFTAAFRRKLNNNTRKESQEVV